MVDALVVVVVVARGDFLLLLLFLLLSLTTFCACCDEPTVDDDFVVVFFDASLAISVVDVDVVATCKSDGKRRRLLVFTVILVVVVEDVRLLRGRSILDTAADDAADDGDGGQNAVTPSIFGPTIITVVHNMQKKDEVDIIRTIIEARNDDLVYLEFEFGAE